MQLHNEVTLITILTELQTEFVVRSGGSGRDLVLWRNLNKTHRTGKTVCLSKRFQIIIITKNSVNSSKIECKESYKDTE
jgi:hypothetical protein